MLERPSGRVLWTTYSPGDGVIAYKVVELSVVTDESLEEAINDTVKDGWFLDGIHFAMREASKRPAMAFILFTRKEDEPGRES